MSVNSHINLGLLELQVLWLLGKHPAHGYALMQQLSKIKRHAITQGTLYPLLAKLLRKKLAHSKSEREGGKLRKTYSLTEKGKGIMEESCRQFVEVYAGMVVDYDCSGCTGAKHSALAQYYPIAFGE